MSTKTKRIIISSVLGGVFLALLILGSIFDLQISKALAIPSDTYLVPNIFTAFFESFGENILYLLIGMACAIIIWYSARLKNKGWRITVQVIFGLIGFAIWLFCVHRTLGHIGKHISADASKYMSSGVIVLIKLCTALTLNILTILCFKGCSEETLSKLFKWAIVILVAAALSNGIVQGLKLFWGRMRYCAMNVLNDFDGYSPWYVIHGKRTISEQQALLGLTSGTYNSFPSGHTCAATSSFLLICLPALFKKWNTPWGKLFCIGVPSIYTFLVALSRIMCGAHFLTDVLFSFLITFGVILLIKWLVIGEGYKKFVKKQTPVIDKKTE